MSLSLEAVRNRPVGWWLMGGSSPYADYSGYGSVGTGPITKAVALVSGAANSTVVSNTSTASFDSTVFQAGQEAQPFSLEATVRQIKATYAADSYQQILGNSGNMDGLVLNGTKVSFRTKHHGYSYLVQSEDAVFYYPLTESEGEAAREASGFSRDGTYMSGDHASIDGPVAGTKSPNGGYVEVNGFNPGNHQQLTIISWFKIPAAEFTANDTLWGFGEDNWDVRFDSNTTITMHTYNDMDEATSVLSGTLLTPIDDDAWHMLAITWDGVAGTANAYVDGTLLDSATFTANTWPRAFSTPWYLGTAAPTSRLWVGGYGQVSVHNRVLTTAEMDSIRTSVGDGPGGEIAAVYDMQERQSVHLIGIHTQQKNALYVNGKLVAETEIPEYMRKSPFASSDGKLYSGLSSGTDQLAINGIGIYPNVLTEDAARRNFEQSRYSLGKAGTPNAFGGYRMELSKDYSNIFLEQVWSEQEHWEAGQHSGTVAQEGLLMPSMDSSTSIASEWQDVFALDFAEVLSIYGVSVDWSGTGATVEVSVDDGVTWEVAERGKKIGLIPNGYNPTDKELLIKVSFAGGIVGDESYLDNLVVTGFLNASQQIDARLVNYNNPAIPKKEYEVLEYNDNWGIDLAGSSIVINAAVDEDTEAVHPKTLEVWVRQYGTTAFATSIVGGTIYTNGEAGSAERRGEWKLYHLTIATPMSTNITLSGDAQIGQVVFYDDELSASQISNIYRGYVGMPVTTVGDSSTIAVPETGAGAEVYAHDWTIEGAG